MAATETSSSSTSKLENEAFQQKDSCESNETTCKCTPTEMRIWNDSLVDRCSEISIIGLRFVVQPSSSTSLRLFWTVLILIGIGFSAYQIEDRVSYLLSTPTSTEIRVEKVDSMRFPTVTFCNENRMQKTTADYYNLTTKLRALTSSLWEFPFNSSSLPDGLNTSDRPDWSIVYRNGSQNINQTFRWVLLNGEPVSPKSIAVTPTSYGYCFTFNSDESDFYNISAPGVQMGMDVLINAQQNEYSFLNYATAGFRMMLHHHKEVSNQISNYGFIVAPGLFYKIIVDAEIIIDLPSPYSNCDESPNYTKSSCITDCYDKMMIKQCGCKDIHVQGRPDVPVCGPVQLYHCNVGSINTCNCPDKCKTLFYNHIVNQAFITDVLPRTINKSDSIMLQIYFTDLKYTYIEKSPSYTTLALWCDIGGALSLILGGTLLTFVELIDVAAILINRYLKIRQLRNRSRVSSSTDGTIQPPQ